MGNISQEQGWTEEEIPVMDPMEAESTNKSGGSKTYIGASINRQVKGMVGIQVK